MEHSLFFFINVVLFMGILFLERKRWKDYVLLGVFTLVAAFVFENATAYMGLWVYRSQPKVLLISLYAWLLYVPYIGYCYFLGRRLGGHA
jgi:hypothetical protein